MKQIPAPGTCILTHCGDTITFRLFVNKGQATTGNAVLRTSLGGARAYRKEVVAASDQGRPMLAHHWNDIPMKEVAPGEFAVSMPLADIGTFRAKACFFATNSKKPHWPEGGDVIIKTAPAWTAAHTSVYTAFPRQFHPAFVSRPNNPLPESEALAEHDRNGWTVIPPSGTFRDLIKKLDTILGVERFRIIQLLPIHPTPTTYAKMGRYGSPFAGTDFLAVDPALAEFDTGATPLDQFRELVNAVHSYGARIFLDLPANHTGWASTLQTHHPEWFKREHDGRFHSPGAWGIVWEDLVELDYSKPELKQFIAGVFEFWCSQGVDGFRCDAGYMVPADVWRYVVARVRHRFPDTVFLLEGLGGKISVTRQLICDEGLDWAYSEIFQTEDRSAFEHYLPGALAMSYEIGPLTNFAETHDNCRMAAKSPAYAKLRTALAALSAHQGCFGITNGVEWFATQKVDVHGASALNWDAENNQVHLLGRLNCILSNHPAFGPGAAVGMIQYGAGNSLAIIRTPTCSNDIDGVRCFDNNQKVLALINLDAENAQNVSWATHEFYINPEACVDLIEGKRIAHRATIENNTHSIYLEPGEVLCLTNDIDGFEAINKIQHSPKSYYCEMVRHQELRATALRIRQAILGSNSPLEANESVEEMAEKLSADPEKFISELFPVGTMPPIVHCTLPEDQSRTIMVAPKHFMLIEASEPFRCCVDLLNGDLIANLRSIQFDNGKYYVILSPIKKQTNGIHNARLKLDLSSATAKKQILIDLRLLPEASIDAPAMLKRTYSSEEVLNGNIVALLTNGCGAMAHVRAKWGDIQSQYDALLAANPDPRVPCDRHILFTRCKLWVINNGFSTEVDSSCLECFECEAGSGKANWVFSIPVGTGRFIRLNVGLELLKHENHVRLSVLREKSNNCLDMLDDNNEVNIVFRPDIESRNFHCKTKAFSGPEAEWGNAVSTIAHGFSFLPSNGLGLDMVISQGDFTFEPEWHYMIAHPHEANRGQDGSSDLYSPGWFGSRIKGGAAVAIEAALYGGNGSEHLLPSSASAIKATAMPKQLSPIELTAALSDALRDFIVKRDELKTVIAGYPWFLDWGRDTFIALRGMIADKRYDEALDIIVKFGQFEEGGTLPNMINGNNAANRDTSDAQLWYAVATTDLIKKIGKATVLNAKCGERTVADVLLSIANGYLNGTPNGIKVDVESGLVYSPSHFTWMDTNYPAGTPRQGYPIEIQALWIATLDLIKTIDSKGPWARLQSLARESIKLLFWLPEKGFLSDCLHCDGFRPASTCPADDHLRCNQLFAITLGAIIDHELNRKIITATEKLLVPGGIRTLAPGETKYRLPICRDGNCLNDPAHPYWGRYEGDEDTRRKPAYHNGTAWTWPYPSYAEALLIEYGESARATASALIASGIELMEKDCAGQLPEIMDGDTPHYGRGCDAQAWGISEFLRVAILTTQS
jgi:predicted glycogen debranching enzyme